MEAELDFNKCSDETLIDIYRKGDEAAIEVLFERYKDIVRKKAKAMYLAGGDSDDLIQEGMIGLYKAVRDYDDTKEAAFKTFASMCINRQLINAVAVSNRKKNIPLNTYVSFDMPAYPDEDNETRLVDILKPESEQNPEKLFIVIHSKKSCLTGLAALKNRCCSCIWKIMITGRLQCFWEKLQNQ